MCSLSVSVAAHCAYSINNKQVSVVTFCCTAKKSNNNPHTFTYYMSSFSIFRLLRDIFELNSTQIYKMYIGSAKFRTWTFDGESGARASGVKGESPGLRSQEAKTVKLIAF